MKSIFWFLKKIVSIPGFEYSRELGYCVDINECDNNPCQAGQHCINKMHTYECASCPEGYDLLPCAYDNTCEPEQDPTACYDVNECELDSNICGGNTTLTTMHYNECVNTDGSYTCVCNPGYRLDTVEERCYVLPAEHDRTFTNGY